MNVPTILNVAAALCLVLAVVLLLARAFGSASRRKRGPDPTAEIHVLSRVSLAPKQGVAVVEVGGRRMIVSFGEGGVRLVSHAGLVEREATRPVEDVPPARSAVPIDLSGRLRRSARSVVLSLVLIGVVGHGVAAQTPPAPAPVSATVAADSAAESGRLAPPVTSPLGSGAAAPAAVEPLGPEVLWDLMKAAGLNGDDEQDRLLPGPVGAVLFVGFLTLIPTLLLLMTGFTRILVVLNLLRQAVGVQTAPPTHLLIALALLLTSFVMSPTLQEVNTVALRPWVDGQIDELQMLRAAAGPFRDFMISQVREQDLAMFAEMQQVRPERIEDIALPVVTSAFVTSELRRAFQIGFALFLPFVVIDVVVASVLMSMGMFMLPPVMVSLPFKLLLFVLVDGWALMLGGLVRSFVT